MKTDEFLKSKWLRQKNCPICGKEFYPTLEWVYKVDEVPYCSWTCYRKAPPPKEVILGAPVRRIIDQYSLEGEYIETYKGLTPASDAVYGSEDSIAAAIREKRPYKGYLWRYQEDDMS